MAIRENKSKIVCANCGEPTNFGNATGPRKTKQWCQACWKMYDKYAPRHAPAGDDRLWLSRNPLGTRRIGDTGGVSNDD